MNPPTSADIKIPPQAIAAIEDNAIMWLTERDDGFTPVREREYIQWLSADPRHAASVIRLEQTLNLLGKLPQFRVELNTEFDRMPPVVPFCSPLDSQAPIRKAHRWPQALVWIAAAALALGTHTAWRLWQDPAEARYSTTIAGYELARLADGSTIELNAASAVVVQFSGGERRVKLETGEAHFAVTHDTTRPFVVVAGDISVCAVGTAFNVRHTPEGEIEVIVTEGKVRVGDNRTASLFAPTTQLVAAGERLVMLKQTPQPVVKKITPTALRDSLAWQSGLVKFADAPLVDVIASFNTRNEIQLVIADANLASLHIGGTFNLKEAEAFVRLLEHGGEIRSEKRNGTEIILRSAH